MEQDIIYIYSEVYIVLEVRQWSRVYSEVYIVLEVHNRDGPWLPWTQRCQSPPSVSP